MQRQEIEVEIDPEGRVMYRITGVHGSGCEAISELLERLGEVESSERTAEFYDQEPDARVDLHAGTE